MNDSWGLTAIGFLRPSYGDLLDSFEVKAKELFGRSINLSARSPLGIFLRIFAWIAGLTWQLAEDVYNSGFLDTATGVSLARLGAFIGIRLLSARKATGELTITGEPGAAVFAGLLVQADNNQRFVTLVSTVLGADGEATVPIQAYDAGPQGNVAVGTITTVVTPLSAITAVINNAATSGGRDRESEQEFRERYANSVDKPGGSNTDAIRAALLQDATIAAAVVWENDTDEVDADGLAPHSIEAIVYGGGDVNIASTILTHKAAGIATNGDTSIQLYDRSGRLKTIYFSRPVAVSIFLQITSLVTDETYGGDDTIQDALITFIGSEVGSVVTNGLGIGADVIYTQLMTPINAVTGVVDYSLDISIDGITWKKANIDISAREKAVTSADKVVISV